MTNCAPTPRCSERLLRIHLPRWLRCWITSTARKRSPRPRPPAPSQSSKWRDYRSSGSTTAGWRSIWRESTEYRISASCWPPGRPRDWCRIRDQPGLAAVPRCPAADRHNPRLPARPPRRQGVYTTRRRDRHGRAERIARAKPRDGVCAATALSVRPQFPRERPTERPPEEATPPVPHPPATSWERPTARPERIGSSPTRAARQTRRVCPTCND